MRRESLADGGHDKVIRKCSRDRSRNKASRHCNPQTWWRRTTAALLGVSFGSYRRRRRDVLMGRRGYVPLRRLGDIKLRRRWVFHLRLIWNVVETYWWNVVITSPWDIVMTYQQDVVKTYLRRRWDVLATFHCNVVECFIWDVPATSLGRTERCRHDVATPSCCWVIGRW